MPLIDLATYDGPDRVISVTEMQEEIRKSAKSLTFSVKSRITGLDEACDGFRGGELVSISGPTKNGKSLLSQTLTKNFYKQNYLSLWFSFELPPKQFIDCFRDELPVIYMPKILKAADMAWIEDRIMESFMKYRTRIVFLDHLHYLFDIARAKSPSIEIGTVIRKLKLLAVREGFLIFLMCHTTKAKSEDGDTSYEHIRDSSMVAQESDTVFIVQRRPKIAENAATCSVEFHRRTGVIKKKIWLAKQQDGFMYEVMPPEEPEEAKTRRKHWTD